MCYCPVCVLFNVCLRVCLQCEVAWTMFVYARVFVCVCECVCGSLLCLCACALFVDYSMTLYGVFLIVGFVVFVCLCGCCRLRVDCDILCVVI